MVNIQPLGTTLSDEPLISGVILRNNNRPILSLKNTFASTDLSIHMTSGTKNWVYGIDNDKNAFKINRLSDGINNTLDDGSNYFAIEESTGNIGLGTDTPDVALDLESEGADIRFSDSDDSAIEWYEDGSEVASLSHTINTFELKNAIVNGDLVIDAVDEVIIRNDGQDVMFVSQDEVFIDDVLRLQPRVTAPACVEGRIYFSSITSKVRVCSGGIWKNLQFE